MRKSFALRTLPLLALAIMGQAHAATEADLEKSFFPYKASAPSAAGLAAGTIINKGNIEQFMDSVDLGMYQIIKNGWPLGGSLCDLCFRLLIEN